MHRVLFSPKNLLSGLVLFSFLFVPLFAGADVRSFIDSVGQTSGLPHGSFSELLLNFMLWLLKIFTILAIISFIISGLMFMLSGLNKGLADTARTAFSYSIIGIGVGLSGYIIIFLISQLLFGTALGR